MEDIKMSNARNQLNYSNDLFFKYTLSREDEGSVYARNTIIERVTGIKVKESTVLNPNLDPGIIGKKRIILDVHVKDEQNRHSRKTADQGSYRPVHADAEGAFDFRLQTDDRRDTRIKGNASADIEEFVNQATDENGQRRFDDQFSHSSEGEQFSR